VVPTAGDLDLKGVASSSHAVATFVGRIDTLQILQNLDLLALRSSTNADLDGFETLVTASGQLSISRVAFGDVHNIFTKPDSGGSSKANFSRDLVSTAECLIDVNWVIL